MIHLFCSQTGWLRFSLGGPGLGWHGFFTGKEWGQGLNGLLIILKVPETWQKIQWVSITVHSF